MSAASETIQPANHVYPKISNRRTRTRVAKSAQAATQLLSVHCLYQAIRKSARGNRFFRTKVYRDGSENRGGRQNPIGSHLQPSPGAQFQPDANDARCASVANKLRHSNPQAAATSNRRSEAAQEFSRCPG